MTIKKRLFTLMLTSLIMLFSAGSYALAESLPGKPNPPSLSPSTARIMIDGKLTTSLPVVVDKQGQSMISLHSAILLFSCNLEFKDDGTLQLNRLDKKQVYPSGQYLCIRPGEDLNALERLEACYLPLRKVASDFAYAVVYNPKIPSLHIMGPSYQEDHPEETQPVLEEAPPIPPEPPADLPTWGTLKEDLASRWPGEKVIGAYYTKLLDRSEGRTTNVILSCEKINGTIIKSGEVFSFNRTVGERSSAAGYKQAKIFVGNTVANGLGGGICQTATTLYNACLEAHLSVLERYPHTLKVAYCPPKRDATVSWGGADLKIKNNLNRPIKILCCVYGQYVLAAFVEAGAAQ